MRISDWSSDVCSSDLHDTGTINMTALAYLFRNISDFDNLADRFRLRNKRPATGAANQYARGLQLAEGSVRGHARYVELLHQFSFRRKIGRASCRERVCQYG